MLPLTKHARIPFRWIILAAACLFGCDSPMVNSPIDVNKFERHQMASHAVSRQPLLPLEPTPPTGSGTLPLNGRLRVPGGPFPTFASITGEVTYSLASMPYRRALRINLDLLTDATLVPEGGGTTAWPAEGKSHDQLFLLPDGAIILEKNYAVAGSENQMILRLQFLLTAEGIGLKAMQLVSQGWQEETDSLFPRLTTDH